MSDTTTPYVSHKERDSIAFVCDLYEARLSEVIRERDEAREMAAWISVEDRLPETAHRLEFALVATTTLGRETIDQFVLPVEIANTLFVATHAKEGFFTHWMPLPSPPNTPPSND